MQVYPIFLAQRGCSHRCLFCDQQRSNAQSSNLDPGDVRTALEEMLPVTGTGEIAFFGGTFTLLPEALQSCLLELAGEFVAAGRAGGIRLSTRPDALDPRRLMRLSRAGVSTIEIGCQSLDPAVLSVCQRGHGVAEILDSVARCRAAGFRVGLQLMPGLPGATTGEARGSAVAALALQPDFLRIYPTLVIAGTGLARLWQEGRYQPWSLNQAVDICAELLLLCRAQDVPVIRLGLQDDPALTGNLLAGPHHPAFGQLVRSRLWWRAIRSLPEVPGEIQVHPADLADALGHRGSNRQDLLTERPFQVLRQNLAIQRGRLQFAGRNWPVDMLARQVTHHAF